MDGAPLDDARPRARGSRAERLLRPEYVRLREAIEAEMARQGIGQRELSVRLGASFALLHKVLGGRRTLEFTELLDLAAELGVDPAELVREAVGG